jgi:TRAP-type C4-dicarboxylate transport system permease small subunit
MILLQQLPRIGSPILGYIIPALIFAFSFFVAWALYKRFTRQLQNSDESDKQSDG